MSDSEYRFRCPECGAETDDPAMKQLEMLITENERLQQVQRERDEVQAETECELVDILLDVVKEACNDDGALNSNGRPAYERAIGTLAVYGRVEIVDAAGRARLKERGE